MLPKSFAIKILSGLVRRGGRGIGLLSLWVGSASVTLAQINPNQPTIPTNPLPSPTAPIPRPLPQTEPAPTVPTAPLLREPLPSTQQREPELPAPPQRSPLSPLDVDLQVPGGVLSVNLSCRNAVGNIAQRMAACQSILGWQRRLGDRLGEMLTLYDVGVLLSKQQKFELGNVFFKQAIGRSYLLPISDWQIGDRAQLIPPIYRPLAGNLFSLGQLTQGLAVMEAMKQTELFAAMGEMPSPGPLPEVLASTPAETTVMTSYFSLVDFGQKVEACKQTNCAELSQLNDQLQKLIEEFNTKTDTYEKEIRQRRAEDDAFLDPRRLPKLREIVESQPGTLLIYPLVLEDRLWLIWAAPGGVVKSEEIPVRSQEIGLAVQRFRQLVQDPTAPTAAIQAAGRQLYDWLVKPLEPELQRGKIQNLVFALDRMTRYIPVSALFDGRQYLVETYTTSTILSGELTDLRDRLPAPIQKTPVLAMGASKFASLNPLPYVPIELGLIVQNASTPLEGIYPGKEFLNQAFDFRTLRDHLTGHRILHIATHGAFVPGRPQDSYLVMGTNEKMFIPNVRILQDLVNVHLVVLSACETAVGGPNQDGIEISGMAYSFMNSGAKAVIASLWTVDDASTSQLMHRFYQGLSSRAPTPPTKAQALRQAQLVLLRGEVQRSHVRGLGVVGTGEDERSTPRPATFTKPYYWAPFILLGNPL